jgi:ureidoglycolate lyase
VNYAKDTWHHPLLALKQSDFIVIDRGGEGKNLVEEDLAESIWLVL